MDKFFIWSSFTHPNVASNMYDFLSEDLWKKYIYNEWCLELLEIS